MRSGVSLAAALGKAGKLQGGTDVELLDPDTRLLDLSDPEVRYECGRIVFLHYSLLAQAIAKRLGELNIGFVDMEYCGESYSRYLQFENKAYADRFLEIVQLPYSDGSEDGTNVCVRRKELASTLQAISKVQS